MNKDKTLIVDEVTKIMAENQKTPFVNDAKEYGQTIVPVPRPEKEIGIDTKEYILQNIINAATSSVLNLGEIESFSQVSRSRD